MKYRAGEYLKDCRIAFVPKDSATKYSLKLPHDMVVNDFTKNFNIYNDIYDWMDLGCKAKKAKNIDYPITIYEGSTIEVSVKLSFTKGAYIEKCIHNGLYKRSVDDKIDRFLYIVAFFEKRKVSELYNEYVAPKLKNISNIEYYDTINIEYYKAIFG